MWGTAHFFSFSSLSSFCLARKFHGENKNLAGGKQNKAQSGKQDQKKKERERERDLKVSFGVNFREENPQSVSVVPL